MTDYEEAAAIGTGFGLAVEPRGPDRVEVSTTALRRVLEVFGATRESEHMQIVIALMAGSPEARDVVDQMDPIEELRFAEVFVKVHPEAQRILDELREWVNTTPVIGDLKL